MKTAQEQTSRDRGRPAPLHSRVGLLPPGSEGNRPGAPRSLSPSARGGRARNPGCGSAAASWSPVPPGGWQAGTRADARSGRRAGVPGPYPGGRAAAPARRAGRAGRAGRAAAACPGRRCGPLAAPGSRRARGGADRPVSRPRGARATRPAPPAAAGPGSPALRPPGGEQRKEPRERLCGRLLPQLRGRRPDKAAALRPPSPTPPGRSDPAAPWALTEACAAPGGTRRGTRLGERKTGCPAPGQGHRARTSWASGAKEQPVRRPRDRGSCIPPHLRPRKHKVTYDPGLSGGNSRRRDGRWRLSGRPAPAFPRPHLSVPQSPERRGQGSPEFPAGRGLRGPLRGGSSGRPGTPRGGGGQWGFSRVGGLRVPRGAEPPASSQGIAAAGRARSPQPTCCHSQDLFGFVKLRAWSHNKRSEEPIVFSRSCIRSGNGEGLGNTFSPTYGF